MFDWQTDDDQAEWIESEQTASIIPVRPRRYRWWLFFVLGLVVTGGIVYYQAVQRVNAATNATKQEILDIHHLLMRAANEEDVDLFWGNLSAVEPDWNAMLKTQIENDTFFDRQFYGEGFVADETAVTATINDITLSDNFLQAEVQYSLPYVIEVGEGMTETVELMQTAVYRKGRERWLYAFPKPEFWGEWQTHELPRLKLHVRDKDSDLALEYGTQINQYLEQLCDEYGFDCQENWQLEVRLTPDVIENVNEPRLNLSETDFQIFQLPTPTVVGIPQSEEAKVMQQHSYAHIIITHAMVDLVGYDCCRHQNLFSLVVDKQLSELGIRPFPFTPEQYAHLFNRWDSGNFRVVWNSQEMTHEDRQVGFLQHLFVEHELGISNKLLAEALVQRDENEPIYALYQELFRIQNESNLEADLIRFVYENSSYSNRAFQGVLSNESIYLSCMANTPSPELSIYSYSFPDENWEQKWRHPLDRTIPITFLQPVKNSNHFVVNFRTFTNNNNGTGSISLWREEGLLPLTSGEENVGFYLPELINNGANLIVQKYYDNSISRSETVIFDLNNCTDEGCQHSVVSEFSFYQFSPNKENILFYGNSSEFHPSHTFFGGDVYLTNDISQIGTQIAENVQQVEWFGDRHIIYLQFVEDNTLIQWQLNLYDIETATTQILYSSKDSEITEISEEQQLSGLSLSASFEHNSLAYIRFLPRGQSPEERGWVEFVFDVDVDTGIADVQQLPKRVGDTDTFTSLFDDWLMFGDYSNFNGNAFALTLFNIGTSQTYEIDGVDFNFDIWSDDLEWVIYSLNESQLALLELDSGYRYLLPPHEGQNCSTLNWRSGS